jgi:UDP-N-acetyl-D-mannosaminuronic acid dehydrogenase
MTSGSICVVGLGYIGLPTAAMFAANGKNVVGVDINEYVVATINAGKIHIVEPDLDIIVNRAVNKGSLRATLSAESADVFIIAVPTPFFQREDETVIPAPDLTHIKSAAQMIAKVLKKGDLIILESTSPVGTTEKLAKWIAIERSDLTFPHTHGEDSDIRIAYCPERVLPGKIVTELVKNDRLIGGITTKCSNEAVRVYQTFVEGACLITNSQTAEMAKLTENASRDVSIAFANELSIICDGLNIDVSELIRLANHHPRVNILQPGCGVGGHCISVDPWFIVSQNPDSAKLIRAARDVNDLKPVWVVEKVKSKIDEYLSANKRMCKTDMTIACYGLAFKPDIDDLRDSPALRIARLIGLSFEGQVVAVEPNIKIYEGSEFDLVSGEIALKNADINVFLVAHSEFKHLKIDSDACLDFCGIFNNVVLEN